MKYGGIVLLIALGACTPKQPVATPTTGTCSIDALTSFVGRTYDASLGDEMREASGARDIRPLSPGSIATMDFRTDRLNVRLDAKGVVTGVDCG